MASDYSQEALNKGVINSITNGNVSDLAFFLEDGGDPDARDADGLTALHLAVYHQRHTMAELLLQKDADVHAVSDGFGYTALHYAVNRKDARLVELLIAFEADIHARTNSGQTPLHRAATVGAKDICVMLLDAGADLMATDNAGRTPLMAAHQHFCGAKTPLCYAETGAFLAEQETMMRAAAESQQAAAWRDAHRDVTKRFRLKP